MEPRPPTRDGNNGEVPHAVTALPPWEVSRDGRSGLRRDLPKAAFAAARVHPLGHACWPGHEESLIV